MNAVYSQNIQTSLQCLISLMVEEVLILFIGNTVLLSTLSKVIMMKWQIIFHLQLWNTWLGFHCHSCDSVAHKTRHFYAHKI